MEAQRVIEQIGSDGKLHLDLKQYSGMSVEVIILPLEQDMSIDEVAVLQMQTGFVQEVLASSEEDVWNDL